MKKTSLMCTKNEKRKNVTDLRFRRISLRFGAGPNMDRKLNKNWNDVSTETEKYCLQLQK